MKPKHEIGHSGLHGALYYHWAYDTEIFDLERHRVALPAVYLSLSYTGCRIGAIVESDCKGIAGTNEALCYKDLKLKLLNPPGGVALLVLEMTIRWDKGKRKRNCP